MADNDQVKAVLGNARHQMGMFLENLGESAQGINGLMVIQEALLGVQEMGASDDMSEYRLMVAIHLGDMFLRDVPSAELSLLFNEAGELDELLVVTTSGPTIEVLGWVDKVLSGEEGEDLSFKYVAALGLIKKFAGARGASALCLSCGHRYSKEEVDNGEQVVTRKGEPATKLRCPTCGAGAYKIGRPPTKS